MIFYPNKYAHWNNYVSLYVSLGIHTSSQNVQRNQICPYVQFEGQGTLRTKLSHNFRIVIFPVLSRQLYTF